MTIHPGILKVAAFAGFPPFVWQHEGRACGADIGILEEFATSLGMKMDVQFFGFGNLWELPGQDMADVAASGLSVKRDRRHSGVAWTAPYSEVRRTALIRAADRERYTRPGDLAGARLAVVPDSAAEAHAREAFPDATLVFCETLALGVAALLDRRVDAIGTGSISARHQLDNTPGLAALDLHRIEDGTEPIAFAVRRRSGLLHALNNFIASRAGNPVPV